MWRFFLQYLKLFGEYNQQRCVTVYRIELQANANWICGGWLPAPQCVSVSVFACGLICVHRPLVLVFDHTCYGGNLVQWYKLLRFFLCLLLRVLGECFYFNSFAHWFFDSSFFARLSRAVWSIYTCLDKWVALAWPIIMITIMGQPCGMVNIKWRGPHRYRATYFYLTEAIRWNGPSTIINGQNYLRIRLAVLMRHSPLTVPSRQRDCNGFWAWIVYELYEANYYDDDCGLLAWCFANYAIST